MNLDEYLKFCRNDAEKLGDSLSGITLLMQEFNLMHISNVYHYTDISGFISIMQKQELWASHIAFMNDKSEYSHGKDLFHQKLIQIIFTLPERERQFLQQVIESLDREMSDGFFTTSSKDVFSLSFSFNSDSLEMWRGYGKNSGIAIGFSQSQCNSLPGMCLIREEMYEKLLEQYGKKEEEVCPKYEKGFFPLTVLYDDNIKSELVNSTIELGLKCFRNQLETGGDMALASTTGTQFLSDMIFYLIPLFKHRGFVGEEECRFVDHFAKRDEGTAYNIHYREQGGIVLPYIGPTEKV